MAAFNEFRSMDVFLLGFSTYFRKKISTDWQIMVFFLAPFLFSQLQKSTIGSERRTSPVKDGLRPYTDIDELFTFVRFTLNRIIFLLTTRTSKIK